MKKSFILIIVLISIICFSCTKKEKLYFDTASNYYDVSYHKDNIVITEFYNGSINKDSFFKKNGEYFSRYSKEPVFSTKHDYEALIDSDYFGYHVFYWKKIYKLRDCQKSSDLKKKREDIFVTEFYKKYENRKNFKDLFFVYYYNGNYKILKIVDVRNADYNVKNITNSRTI